MTPPNPGFRSGYVAIVGRPNVGKSTLLNRLIETKISIVSPKPQTTRESIRGILNAPESQMIFVDTPGWLKPRDSLQSRMRTLIVRAIREDADVVLLLREPSPPSEDDVFLAELIKSSGTPFQVVINKIDKIEVESREKLRASFSSAFGAETPLSLVSAKTGQGVTELRKSLISLLPVSPPYFPTDQITDRWERFYVAELIREVLLEEFREEIPHAAAVVIEEFVEKPNQKDRIKATIYGESDSQKRILVGAGGSAIKRLGSKARTKIETFLNRPVFLELRIKVHRNWRNDSAFLTKMASEH